MRLAQPVRSASLTWPQIWERLKFVGGSSLTRTDIGDRLTGEPEVVHALPSGSASWPAIQMQDLDEDSVPSTHGPQS